MQYRSCCRLNHSTTLFMLAVDGRTCAYFCIGCCCTRCSKSMPESTGAARLLAVQSRTVTTASSRCCFCCRTMPHRYSLSSGARLGGVYDLREIAIIRYVGYRLHYCWQMPSNKSLNTAASTSTSHTLAQYKRTDVCAGVQLPPTRY